MKPQLKMPTGDEFLRLVTTTEQACASSTFGEISSLGRSAPITHALLGDVLSALYCEACCYHACDQGDHFLQRLTARVVNQALASLRLLVAGYYDESLSITRGLGEYANLLFLFVAQPATLEEWRVSDADARWKKYKPAAVRDKLNNANLMPPVDRTRYSLLSEVSAHPSPAAPQAHDSAERPTLGSTFRVTGFLVALNELATVVAESGASISRILDLGDRRIGVEVLCQLLLDSVGGLDLVTARSNQSPPATSNAGVQSPATETK